MNVGHYRIVEHDPILSTLWFITMHVSLHL
jgi:hypothetical protein